MVIPNVNHHVQRLTNRPNVRLFLEVTLDLSLKRITPFAWHVIMHLTFDIFHQVPRNWNSFKAAWVRSFAHLPAFYNGFFSRFVWNVIAILSRCLALYRGIQSQKMHKQANKFVVFFSLAERRIHFFSSFNSNKMKTIFTALKYLSKIERIDRYSN